MIVAIDPGLTGAVCAMTEAGEVKLCADLPILRDRKLAWCDGEELVSMLAGCTCRTDDGPIACFIERAQSMPRQGVSSTFGYGVVFGSIIQAMHWARLEFVTAAQWKRDLHLSADKNAARDTALRLFPSARPYLERCKDHNRAEAILLAEWARTRGQRAAA